MVVKAPRKDWSIKCELDKAAARTLSKTEPDSAALKAACPDDYQLVSCVTNGRTNVRAMDAAKQCAPDVVLFCKNAPKGKRVVVASGNALAAIGEEALCSGDGDAGSGGGDAR